MPLGKYITVRSTIWTVQLVVTTPNMEYWSAQGTLYFIEGLDLRHLHCSSLHEVTTTKCGWFFWVFIINKKQYECTHASKSLFTIYLPVWGVHWMEQFYKHWLLPLSLRKHTQVLHNTVLGLDTRQLSLPSGGLQWVKQTSSDCRAPERTEYKQFWNTD